MSWFKNLFLAQAKPYRFTRDPDAEITCIGIIGRRGYHDHSPVVFSPVGSFHHLTLSIIYPVSSLIIWQLATLSGIGLRTFEAIELKKFLAKVWNKSVAFSVPHCIFVAQPISHSASSYLAKPNCNAGSSRVWWFKRPKRKYWTTLWSPWHKTPTVKGPKFLGTIVYATLFLQCTLLYSMISRCTKSRFDGLLVFLTLIDPHWSIHSGFLTVGQCTKRTTTPCGYIRVNLLCD